MSCFFRCIGFRNNGDGRGKHLVPSPIPYTSQMDHESLVTKRQLGSFFLNDERGSPPDQVLSPIAKYTFESNSLYGELRREADFLKACGALLQTPAEIRKASRTEICHSPDKDDNASFSCISNLPGNSCKKKLWDEKHDFSGCPLQVQNNAGISHDTDSCIFKGHQSLQQSECSLLSVNLSNSTVCEGVRNESVVELVEIPSPYISSFKKESQIQPFASEVSPFPTPLKVTDEMETPSTVYLDNMHYVRSSKNTRIRTQYVYPFCNPAESSYHEMLNESISETFQSNEIFDKHINHSSHSEEPELLSLTIGPEGSQFSCYPRFASPSNKRRQTDEVVYTDKHIYGKTLGGLKTPFSSRDTTNSSREYPEQEIPSLSQWLKPSIAGDRMHDDISSHENSRSGKSSDVDRPILGMVAAHWKDEGRERKSSERWDGNGIPNSTNKYKEDQRVSWHATPFEERLEKALSDENFLPKRRFMNRKPMELEDESELSDTATS